MIEINFTIFFKIYIKLPFYNILKKKRKKKIIDNSVSFFIFFFFFFILLFGLVHDKSITKPII